MKAFFKSLTIVLLLHVSTINAQNKIFGRISNDSGIMNVNISLLEIDKKTTSDESGHYNILDVPNGTYTLSFSHIGYKNQDRTIELNKSIELNITLEKNVIELGEAKIVSSKRETAIKDVSLPIEYIDKTKLQSTTLVTISDVMQNEGGISVVRDGPWATTANIRGLSGQNIVYLIDGNRIETSTNISAGLSLIDVNDLESVEIVKGGISSLYGTGATGGVINIISKNAQFNPMTYFSSELINSYNSVNNSYSNYLNLKLGSINWSAKINGAFRKADDTQTPNGKLENSSFKDESLNANFNYAPIEDLHIKLNYQKFSAYDVGIPGGAPFPKPATAKYNYAKRALINTAIEYKNISESLLKVNLKYYHQVISRSVEIKPNQLVTANPIADHTTNGLSFQSDWIVNKVNYLIAGAEYWQREYEGIRTITNLASNVVKVDKPVPNSKFGSFGVFVKDDIKFNDKFNISLSARYDFINITNEETKNPQYVIINGTKNTTVRDELASYKAYDESDKSISGGLGTIYKLTDEYDIVFNLGYNFRSPSLEERYQYIDLGGIVYLGSPDLKSEEGISTDLGFRVWKDDITFRFNVFYNSFSNLVVDDVLYMDSIYVKRNVGEARLYGFDSRLDFNFYRDYLVYASAGYVRGEDITNNSNLPQIAPLNGLIGVIIPVYDLFNIDLSASFAADQNKVGLGENTTGGFAYYDLSLISEPIEFGFVNMKVITGIQNLFGREYREHLSTYRGIEMVEPGRNIFAKLIFNFK